MRIKRAVEVWEKGMDGAPCGQWLVADTVSTIYLYQLFAAEQRVPDPDMLLSYFLNAKQIAALQPYVAEEMRADQYDFILTAYGEPDEATSAP